MVYGCTFYACLLMIVCCLYEATHKRLISGMHCYADCWLKFIWLWCWRCLAVSYWWICWVSEWEWHYPKWSDHTIMHSVKCCLGKFDISLVFCDELCYSVIEQLLFVRGGEIQSKICKKKRTWLARTNSFLLTSNSIIFWWDCWYVASIVELVTGASDTFCYYLIPFNWIINSCTISCY